MSIITMAFVLRAQLLILAFAIDPLLTVAISLVTPNLKVVLNSVISYLWKILQKQVGVRYRRRSCMLEKTKESLATRNIIPRSGEPTDPPSTNQEEPTPGTEPPGESEIMMRSPISYGLGGVNEVTRNYVRCRKGQRRGFKKFQKLTVGQQ